MPTRFTINSDGTVTITPAANTEGLVVGSDSEPTGGFGDLNVWQTSALGEHASQIAGIWVVRYGDPTAQYTGLLEGADITAAIKASNSQNVTQLQGIGGAVVHGGSGTIENAYAIAALIQNNSTGKITKAAAFYAYAPEDPNPGDPPRKITTAYGLYIEKPTVADNNVGVYIAGGDTVALWVDSGPVRFDENVIMPSGYIELTEITAPANGGSNTGRLFVRDNGAGKSQLCVIFASGAVQVLATEP